MRVLSTLSLLALAAAATSGCKQAVLCSPLADCGGPPPIGVQPGTDSEWVLAPGHPSCTEDLYVPAADTRLVGGTLPVAGTPYPDPAVFDWCVLLVTGPGGPNASNGIQVKPPRFYYADGPIGVASVKYQADGHFAAGLTRTGTFVLDFPAYCVRAFGATDNGPMDPSDPSSPKVDVCGQLQTPVAASGLGEGSYRNTTCVANTDANRAMWNLDGSADPEGCICRFDVTETGGPSGEFQVEGNVITHFPNSNFPQKATFCYQGDRLQLTGYDGLYLFDQKGLRTFDLVRACKGNADCASGNCNLTNSPNGQGICQ